jgi:hypothetical protein
MFNGSFRFSIHTDVCLDEVELTLQLATFAAEGIFGIPRVAMEFHYETDHSKRTFDLEADSDVGVKVTQIFAGLLLKEFGEGAFRLENIKNVPLTA